MGGLTKHISSVYSSIGQAIKMSCLYELEQMKSHIIIIAQFMYAMNNRDGIFLMA